MPQFVKVEDLPGYVGKQLEPSDWLKITQDRVNQFADATNDHQFIHVNRIKAKFTPFRGTIAHGFLSLSLLSHLNEQHIIVPEGTKMSVNYGSNKLRFLSPVRVGKRIRSHQRVVDITEKSPGQWLLTVDVSVEIEGEEKPALIAEMLALFIVK
ncbi:MAG: MaoC family dehydratase [Woeseiaceae bacterium]|nr:MaoC family dehydratase [Woeseiaceae bacterium]